MVPDFSTLLFHFLFHMNFYTFLLSFEHVKDKKLCRCSVIIMFYTFFLQRSSCTIAYIWHCEFLNSEDAANLICVFVFQVKIAIIGITAGGVGLDFSSAQNVVFLELPQSPSLMLQV